MALLVVLEVPFQCFDAGRGIVLLQLVLELVLLDGDEEPVHQGSEGRGVGIGCGPQNVGDGPWGDGCGWCGVLPQLGDVIDTRN
jgi:hypothetical protein